MLKLKRYVSNKSLAIYCLINGLLKILFLVSPLVAKKFIDNAMNKNFNNMLIFGLIDVFLFVLTQVVSYIFDIFSKKVETSAISNIFKEVNENLDTYRVKEHSINRDRINQEITNNLTLIKGFIVDIPVRIVFSIITMIAIFLIMLKLSISLALVMIIVVPVGAYISYKLGYLISDYSEKDLTNNRDIKGYLLDKYSITKSERLLKKKQMFDIKILLENYKNTLNKKYKLESLVNNMMIYFVLNGVIISMYLISGYYVYRNMITIGTFYATQLYVSRFWTPVEYLFDIRNQYLTAKPAINSFMNFMEVKKTRYNYDIIKEIELVNFECLSNKGKVLNEKISMKFDNKNINIISGDNGVGKTTVIESILNYTDRYNGDILINGRILKESYYDMVYISSDYNISNFGLLSNKINFSSGQKKKAQIELALNTDKSVYIIDEPTNFLDEENKIKIANMINELYFKRKIVILITHDSEIINMIKNKKMYFLKKSA